MKEVRILDQNDVGTPMLSLTTCDFNLVYERILWQLVNHGLDIVFGDENELKPAKDIGCLIHFTKSAIDQALNLDVHKRYPIQGEALKEYVDQFLMSPAEMKKKGFEYTYIEMLREYEDSTGQKIDQLEIAKQKIIHELKHETLSSNRNVGLVYHVDFVDNKNMQCFQHFQIRRIKGNKYSLRIIFRSNSVVAWQSNVCGILTCFNELVFKPANACLSEVIWFSESMQLEYTDMDFVETLLNESKHSKNFGKIKWNYE